MNECKINDKQLLAIKDIPLETLSLNNNNITNDGIKNLKGSILSNSIIHLSIDNNPLSKMVLGYFMLFKNLIYISVKGTKIDQSSLKQFTARHQKLKYSGLSLFVTNKKYDFPTYNEFNEDWGNSYFVGALTQLGTVEFNQIQLDAKTSSEHLVFNPNGM